MQNEIDLINQQEPTFLKKAKRSGYICPVCNNGAGKNGTGIILNKKTNHYHCFDCGLNEDVIGLYGKYAKIEDFKEQLAGVAQYYHISLEDKGYTHTDTHTHTYTHKEEQPQEDYTEFYKAAHKELKTHIEYLRSRGLSMETAERFNLGYVQNWKHPNAPNAPGTPRLIIPKTEYSYFARDTRKEIPANQKPYAKMKVNDALFNAAALDLAETPIFIVEGEIDALSIIECGAEAIALSSTSGKNKLIKELETRKPKKPLLLALDNDAAGQRTEEELAEDLIKNNVSFYRVNIYAEYKDANEYLVNNREQFQLAINNALRIEEIKIQEYRDNNSAAGLMQSFINGINESVNTPCIRTNFINLDDVLDGGLYEGLYFIGAISSLGKTSYVLQICDQIAQSGQDILYFTLEMANKELIARSISRNTAIIASEKGLPLNNAKCERAITDGKRYEGYSTEEKRLIANAEKRYMEYANNIYFVEGIGNIGVKEIKEIVKQHISFTGKKPVVVIDYLQILAPYNERATDKQNIDKNVLELKRISRDLKLPILAISSFNRDSYNNSVSESAFKESGSIEYSADVLLALQFEGAGDKNFDINAAKSKDIRKIELLVLKNRHGKPGVKIKYDYYPLFNYFIETLDN